MKTGRRPSFPALLLPLLSLAAVMTAPAGAAGPPPSGVVSVAGDADVGVVAFPPPRNACAGGTISGTVRDTLGGGIAAAEVTAYGRDGSGGATVTADGLGRYSFCLAPGPYGIGFTAPGYIDELYDDTDYGCADAVTVPSGGNIAGIDAVLAKGGGIAGRVTDGVNPIMNVGVIAEGVDIAAYFSDLTDAAGNYRLQGLPTGSYYVRFHGPGIYPHKVYNDKAPFADPDPVKVTAPDTRGGIDAVLPVGGVIAGGVGDGIAGVQNVVVWAYDEKGGLARTAYTDVNGAFLLTGLRPGKYKLYFDGSLPGLQSEWFHDRKSMETADFIDVPETFPAVAFAELALGGAIAGTVTTGGAGVQNIGVFAVDESGELAGSAYTDVLGDYTVAGLPSGRYRLQFDGQQAGMGRVWYDNAESFSSAEVLTVTAPAGLTGIDASLAAGLAATIGGQLTFEGETCPGAHNIVVYEPDPVGDDWAYAEGRVGPTGYWQATVRPGSYRVLADTDPRGGHRMQWYGNSPAFGRSRIIRVPDMNGVSGLDIRLPRNDLQPVPDLAAGGAEHVLTLQRGVKTPLTLALDCNGDRGTPSDWWLLAFTDLPAPRNVWHFEPGRGWVEGMEVSYQGPCADLDSFGLPPLRYYPLGGDVDIYFGVDGTMNGEIDPASLRYDGTRIHMYR